VRSPFRAHRRRGGPQPRPLNRTFHVVPASHGFVHGSLRWRVSAGQNAKRRRREHCKNHNAPGQLLWVDARGWGGSHDDPFRTATQHSPNALWLTPVPPTRKNGSDRAVNGPCSGKPVPESVLFPGEGAAPPGRPLVSDPPYAMSRRCRRMALATHQAAAHPASNRPPRSAPTTTSSTFGGPTKAVVAWTGRNLATRTA
jgi:hypothetical protein